MCIQWCCKNCRDKFTKLTHRPARERCNEYFIARSQDESLKNCPKGPWELRRAFHRHPYRGAQRCDDCIKAGRKDSKLIQAARQRANVALGERPEYAGALYVGELEIPDNFHNAAHPLAPGKVDAMKSDWESFALANEHLPSHELEREWATSFTASNVVGLDAGVRAQPTSTLGQRMGGEDINRNKVPTEEVSQSPHQQIQHISKSAASQGNCTTAEEESSWDTHQRPYQYTNSTRNEPNHTIAEGEASRNTHQQNHQYTNSTSGKQSHTTAAGEAPRDTHQTTHHSNNRITDQGDCATAEEKEASQEPHREVQYKSNTTTRSSSSQSTRARPWVL